jgi:HlyD family secretion protein
MKKRIAIIVVVAAVAVAVTVAVRRARHADDGRLAVSGNIELEETNVAFKVAGRLIERTVDEGDAVAQGAVVARLDRDQLLRQRERERAGLEAALATLAQAETALEWQRATVTADLEQRRAGLSSSEARLRELRNGSRPEEIQEVKAFVEAAESEAGRARKDWERAQKLYKNDDISTSQWDQARNRWEAAEAALKQAGERQALVLAGPRVEVVEAAAAQAEGARAALKLAEANHLETQRREQELGARRAEIARQRAQLAFVESQLDDTVAIAPVSGVVLVKAAELGEVLAPGATVVTVGDIDHPWLRGYINESDLGRVKLGARARVTTDSFPGKTYSGRVSFIASQAEFTPKQIQTAEERVKLVYRIKIQIDNPQRELKSNMPADAEILAP